MQILQNTFIFYVEVPVAYISSFILTFLTFFQGKFWGFLHNRVATLVTIG